MIERKGEKSNAPVKLREQHGKAARTHQGRAHSSCRGVQPAQAGRIGEQARLATHRRGTGGASERVRTDERGGRMRRDRRRARLCEGENSAQQLVDELAVGVGEDGRGQRLDRRTVRRRDI